VTERIKQTSHKNEGPTKIRGVESEKIAQALIESFLYINQAKIVSDNPRADGKKRDIKVLVNRRTFAEFFSTDLAIPKGILWVQIKSSDGGVISARTKIQRKNTITPCQVDNWLNQNKLIIINSRLEADSFEHIFTHNILKMNNYWKEHDHKNGEEVKTP
jgi:hypothetical protein